MKFSQFKKVLNCIFQNDYCTSCFEKMYVLPLHYTGLPNEKYKNFTVA